MDLEQAVMFWCVFSVLLFPPDILFFLLGMFFAGHKLLCLSQDAGASLPELSHHWAASPTSSADLPPDSVSTYATKGWLKPGNFCTIPCYESCNAGLPAPCSSSWNVPKDISDYRYLLRLHIAGENTSGDVTAALLLSAVPQCWLLVSSSLKQQHYQSFENQVRSGNTPEMSRSQLLPQ